MKKILGVLALCAGTSLYAQPGKMKHQNITNNIAAQASAKAAAHASEQAAKASSKAADASLKAAQRATAQAELRAAQQAKFKAALEATTQTKLKSSLTEGQKTNFYEPLDNDHTTKNDLNFQKRLHTNLKNIPAQVQNNFNNDFSTATNINWSKEKGTWYAHYDLNGYSNLAAYSANGTKLYTATKIPSTNLPAAVVTYTSSTATTLSNHDILLINMPGQPSVYQLTLMNGNVVYVNTNGVAVTDFNSNGLAVK